MKYLPVLCLMLLAGFSNQAQTYEIGVILGGANYIGDVGRTNYIYPNHFMGGGILKWNRSRRHSYRASLIMGMIQSSDKDSGNSRREQRGYSFNNSVREVALGIEYTFWEFNVHSGETISTPYLYTGLTLFNYNKLYRKEDQRKMSSYGDGFSFAIPMAIGYKMKIGHHFVVGAEIGARYTFTDNLDGSKPNNPDVDNDAIKFGNLNNNDWYVFSGLTFTVAFGRKPCNTCF